MFETIEEAPIIFMFQSLSGAQEYTSAPYERYQTNIYTIILDTWWSTMTQSYDWIKIN
jgi:hypothetical protein